MIYYSLSGCSGLSSDDVSFPAGFEKRQAELIVSALVTLTTSNMDIVYKDMVTKSHQVGRHTC